MKASQGPHLDERHTEKFAAELRERAQVWIPGWGITDAERDFGRALLEIAARFSSEVAERLDRTGDKMRCGFLDWLAVRGKAARAARLPVVFKLADAAQEAVLASSPVQMQADADGASVVFETENDVRVLPGRLAVVVGIDADQDAYYLSPPGLSDLLRAEPLPTQWRLKSFAAAGATKLQLDPELGLATDMILGVNGQQYKVVKVEKDLVTIEPPLDTELTESIQVSKVTAFSPFGGEARNWQAHALYLGDSELLNIEAEATIDVVGATSLMTGVTWQYWGKVDEDDKVDWQPLSLDDKRQQSINDAVTLTKPKGEIVEYEIGGKKSRWIRAFTKTIQPGARPINVEDFSLRINASTCGNQPAKCPPATPTESPKAEAMTNSTPLVLDTIFLPFGREPRQFDAFYLGSAEAFSKKEAQVRICFELADPTFESLAVVRGTAQFANKVLAGVGRDHGLHLLQFNPQDATISKLFDRDALRPPIPGDSGEVPPSTKPIGLNPKCRPVISTVNNDFFVDVASGGTIWTWHENANDETLSGWKAFSPLPEPPNDPARIDDIVPVIQGSDSRKVVLSSGRLFVHDGTEWSQKETKDMTKDINDDPLPNPQQVTLVALIPIWEDPGGGLEGLKASSEMVGVSDDNRLYRVATNGDCTSLPLVFDTTPHDEELVDAGTASQNSSSSLDAIRPAALKDGDTLTVVTASKARNKLVMYRADTTSNNAPLVKRIKLPVNDLIIGATVEISFVKGEPQFSALCKTPAGGTYVASWQPFATGTLVKDILFRSNVSSLGSLGGTPVTLFAHIVAPGARGDLFVATFNPWQRHELAMPATNPDENGAVLPSTVNPFAMDDAFSIDDSRRAYLVVGVLNIPPDPETLYAVKKPFFGRVGNDPKLRAYRRDKPAHPPFKGRIQGSTRLRLDSNDTKTVEGTFLLIQNRRALAVRKVVSIRAGVAKLDAALSGRGQADYWKPEAVDGRITPIIRLDPVSSGTWPAPILEHARLYFSGTVDPQVQRAKVFAPDDTSHPAVIALLFPWVVPPTAGDHYVIDAILGEWQHVLADTSSNPELSWEYSNGTAWESLVLEEESTLNFKNTGVVRFQVPSNIQAVDWAGKTNYWIRARLISGDYGREKVTVKTTPTGIANETVQTVERSSKDIHAPLVVKLHISYGFCNEVKPLFVLTEDSGTIRDQSEANNTSGAIVEAFVPLAETLRRLSSAATSIPKSNDCPPECNGQARQLTPVETPALSADLQVSDDCPPECNDLLQQANAAQPPVDPAPVPVPPENRALFLGLDALPSEAPVNVLLLVNEHDHATFAPMTVEALVADHFVPIIADDTTRALGESGLLSMAFLNPPTRSDLFGEKGLTWLRLTPKANANASEKWIPALRGAYLNAVWASATETLTRELLGTSDGAPNMVVRLARPPVLDHTLELRVKEPLGDQERAALRKANKASVLNEIDGLPGDWVLWRQVADPNDEPADARVYALEEATGEIRFGDGRHGRIPPIGRDAIVAFSYKRTESGPSGSATVPGNLITARTVLNLVSPVATVESVTAADQAAGGAPAEDDNRVLRFGYSQLRHRNRVVTAHDVEDLALESSPEIVQTRAVVRHGSIHLVVVMKGQNPVPTAAQVRELRRLLLTSAPVSLSAPKALQIQGPEIRSLRIQLQLRTERLDQAGELGRYVKQRLADFFDTTTGGIDRDGWALGLSPSEYDIAFALLDAPYLDSIEQVKLHEIASDESEQPWPDTLKLTELAMLAKDPIRIQFETAEVEI